MADTGTVYLVGGGPGDPDLLTVKAHRLLSRAEVVVYDRLVSEAVFDLLPAGARRVFVGKAGAQHHMPQDEICDLLVSLARAGHDVVRLKGGDPFIFGRGSEEALHLARAGVPYEVVPGVTAASGVGAALGLPLTHRGVATGVRFFTAHRRGDAEDDVDWMRMADPDTTLVLYMGLGTLDGIVERLVGAGLPADTPAAAIAKGTTAAQRQCLAPLAELPAAVARAGLESPVLFVVGRVVELVPALNWQHLPLETASDDQEERAAHA